MHVKNAISWGHGPIMHCHSLLAVYRGFKGNTALNSLGLHSRSTCELRRPRNSRVQLVQVQTCVTWSTCPLMYKTQRACVQNHNPWGIVRGWWWWCQIRLLQFLDETACIFFLSFLSFKSRNFCLRQWTLQLAFRLETIWE